MTLTKLEGADWSCPVDAAAWENAVKALQTSPASNQPPSTVFSKGSLWNAGPEQADAVRAQRWLGERYRNHVKETQPKGARAQFGLPRMFQKGTEPRMERRASPLLLHVHQCPSGKALPCAVWLPADFLPTAPVIPGNGSRAKQFVKDLNSQRA